MIIGTETKRTFENEDINALIEKIKQGDREAFMAVTELYQKKVFRLAYAFFHNHDDAMDIVQETFLRLYQKVHMFQKGKDFQNWLLKIAKNLCIDHYRKNYKKSNELERNKDIGEMNIAAEKDYSVYPTSDLKSIFSRCLKKLTEKQRMIFVMKHYNQLKYAEIAETLDIAVGTVKSLNYKAVRNLRVLISPYLGGGNE